MLKLILDVCMFPELADGINYTSAQCGLSTQLTHGHPQVGTSQWVPSSLSLVWNGKRTGTMAEMLHVGKITPGERPEKGIKRQGHVEGWRRRGEDHTEERSGEEEEVQSQM